MPVQEQILVIMITAKLEQICKSRKEIYECNIVFKVTPPSDDEVDLMPGKSTNLYFCITNFNSTQTGINQTH